MYFQKIISESNKIEVVWKIIKCEAKSQIFKLGVNSVLQSNNLNKHFLTVRNKTTGYKSNYIQEAIYLLKETSLCNVNKLYLKFRKNKKIRKSVKSKYSIIYHGISNVILKHISKNYQPCIKLSL